MMKRRPLRYPRQSDQSVRANRAHQFAAGYALAVYRNRYVFSFIPKNACSTMRYSLAIHNGFIEPGDSVAWIHANNSTFEATQSELACAEFTFVVLRCPFDRLASAYLDKIVGMYRDAWSFRPPGHEDGGPQNASFTDFVRAIADSRQTRANVHWRPQVDYLVYKDYDRYYAFSKIAEMETELRDKHDFELYDTRDHTQHGVHRLAKIEEDCSGLKAFELANLKREGKVPSLAALYNPETIELVRETYNRDLRLYAKKTGEKPSF
jgi:hypothetical protein